MIEVTSEAAIARPANEAFAYLADAENNPTWQQGMERLSPAQATPRSLTAQEQLMSKDDDASPSELIDARIAELGDWRGETLARVRALIHQAEPDVVERVKWRKPSNPGGVPTWELGGIICTGETYKGKVKLTFAQGAALDDPTGVFNASLGGSTRRAIDLREGDELDEDGFKGLVTAAAAYNASG